MDKHAELYHLRSWWIFASFAVALCALGSVARAVTQDAAPPATTVQDTPAASTLRPPGPERFAQQPTTPVELWDAIDYLVRSGQAKLAVPYLDAFSKANADDVMLANIYDQFGVGSILRLSDDPATAPYAQPTLDRMSAAVKRLATHPERLDRSIAQLVGQTGEDAMALHRLRQAGPDAAVAMLKRLTDSGLDAQQRAILTDALGKLDKSAVPVLIAALDSPDETKSAIAARALAALGDTRALAALVFPAANQNSPSALRHAAQAAIGKLSGRASEFQPTAAAQFLAKQAWNYHDHKVSFPSDEVALWTWQGDGPAATNMSRADAESTLGIERAQQALALDPSLESARLAFTSLSLERAARLRGAAAATEDPDGAFSSALATGPAILGKVLRRAIADGHMPLAELTATALGRVTDRDALWASGVSHPLVEALSAPDRRVQLAAADALVSLDPRRAFPGSSRLVPVLARFLGSHNGRRAIVVDGNTPRATTTAAVLNSLGYDAQTVDSGREAFLLAADLASVELILVDPAAIQGPLKWNDLITNLRADARTADIPVLVTGALKQGDMLRPTIDRHAKTDFAVTPTDPELFKPVLERALGRMGARPQSDEERAADAKRAAALLARIAGQPNSPFAANLAAIEPALAVAMANPASSLEATNALGDVPVASAQRSLADRLLDVSQSQELRIAAGTQLVRSIQRFGALLTDNQERRLRQALGENADPALRPIWSAVIGALQPDPGSLSTPAANASGNARGADPEGRSDSSP